MKTSLSAAFADSSAADLTLAYGLPELPALGTHQVVLPAGTVWLRVLGASHQVLFETPGGLWSETVACLPEYAGALPEHDELADSVLRGVFRASTEKLAPDELSARVAELRERCVREPKALFAEFRGAPEAVTALLVGAEAGGARWQTWHAYPQAGELVHTETVVVPR